MGYAVDKITHWQQSCKSRANTSGTMHERSKSLSMTPGIFASGFIWPFGIVRVFVFDGFASEHVREIYIRFQNNPFPTKFGGELRPSDAPWRLEPGIRIKTAQYQLGSLIKLLQHTTAGSSFICSEAPALLCCMAEGGVRMSASTRHSDIPRTYHGTSYGHRTKVVRT